MYAEKAMVGDVRFLRVDDCEPILQIRRQEPAVDASGAVCGFRWTGQWETVPTVHHSRASYADECSYLDLAASGGIVDAP